MIEQPRYVLDASVGLKWLLRLDDEPHQEVADQVLRDYAAGATDLTILPHTVYEIGHALTRAVRRERITADQALQAIRTFDAWDITPVLEYQHFRRRAGSTHLRPRIDLTLSRIQVRRIPVLLTFGLREVLASTFKLKEQRPVDADGVLLEYRPLPDC
jgi:predicted nucleic acid-binding protein